MPNRVDFTDELLQSVARLRARWETDGNDVVTFLVQLEVWHNGEWRGVRRYDDAHGEPHLDLLDDIRDNWERLVTEFLEA